MERPRRAARPSKYVDISSDEDEDERGSEIVGGSEDEGSEFRDSEDDSGCFEEILPVVDVLTDDQVTQTRLLIPEQTAIVEQIQAEYDAQLEVLKAIEDRLRLAGETLFHSRAKIAAVRRLPPELLGEIFIIHVHHNQQSPWVPMHVCRAWRSAALLTRAVWGSILLSPTVVTNKKTGSRARVLNGKEVCVTETQLRRALARAGPTALDLQISFDPKRRRRRSYYYIGSSFVQVYWKQQNHIIDLLRCIKDIQSKPRIRSLEIDTAQSATFGVEHFDSFDFKPLESLSLDRAYPELLKTIADNATNLRRLSLLSIDLQTLAKHSSVHLLEELEIKDHAGQPAEGIHKIRSLLSLARSLTSLTITGGSLTDRTYSTTPSPRIDMPSLKRLDLYKVGDFWPIECLRLTHLTMDTGWRGGMEHFDSGTIQLPCLEFFSYKTEHTMHGLRAFHVPVLREFILEGGSSKASMRQGMGSVWAEGREPNINPVVFRFRSTTVHHKVIADVVNTMSKLEEFETAAVSLTPNFLDQFLPKAKFATKKNARGTGRQGTSRRNPTWLMGAPKLGSIKLDFQGCRVKDEVELYEKSAMDLLQKRQAAKADLSKIEIRITEEDGWMQFMAED